MTFLSLFDRGDLNQVLVDRRMIGKDDRDVAFSAIGDAGIVMSRPVRQDELGRPFDTLRPCFVEVGGYSFAETAVVESGPQLICTEALSLGNGQQSASHTEVVSMQEDRSPQSQIKGLAHLLTERETPLLGFEGRQVAGGPSSSG